VLGGRPRSNAIVVSFVEAAFFAVTGPDDAKGMVDYWAAEGMTSYKAYMNITREELGAAIQEAHAHKRRGLRLFSGRQIFLFDRRYHHVVGVHHLIEMDFCHLRQQFVSVRL
jgi:hypothetical protein